MHAWKRKTRSEIMKPVIRKVEALKLQLLEHHTSTVKSDQQMGDIQRRFAESIAWRQQAAEQIVTAMVAHHSSGRLLLCCYAELQRGVTLLAEGHADPSSEFALTNPDLKPYLRGLAEVAHIAFGCLQFKIASEIRDIHGLLPDLHTRWATLLAHLRPALAHFQLTVRPVDAAQVACCPRCSLSGLPMEDQRAIVLWGAAPVHKTVANLWSHRVSLSPPVARV